MTSMKVNTHLNGAPGKAFASLKLSHEQIESIYPLNKLSQEGITKLRAVMRMMRLRADHSLFSAGDAPDETYWVLDGVLQLADRHMERLETVSPAQDSVSMPLPYMVPSNESAHALVDCTILCVPRRDLTEVLSRHNIELMVPGLSQPDSTRKSSAELFREFERLRNAQRARVDPASEDPVLLDPFASVPPEKLRPPQLPAHPPKAASPPVPTQPRPQILPDISRRGTSGPRPVGCDDVHLAFTAFETLPGFARLDLTVRAECLQACQMLNFASGQVVIRQGEVADAWYLVIAGECRVLFSDHRTELEVNRYSTGDCFGEDGLISGQPRNASVEAVTDLHVLRLPAQAFRELLVPRMTQPVGATQLGQKRFANAVWLDVRLPRERSEWMIDEAIEIPWPVIRAHPFSNGRGRPCIVVGCERQAQTVAFMLRKFGFDAYYLEGGFEQVPAVKLRERLASGRAAPGGVVRIC